MFATFPQETQDAIVHYEHRKGNSIHMHFAVKKFWRCRNIDLLANGILTRKAAAKITQIVDTLEKMYERIGPKATRLLVRCRTGRGKGRRKAHSINGIIADMSEDTTWRLRTLRDKAPRCECCHTGYSTCGYVVRLGYKRLHADLKIHEKSGTLRVWVCEKCAAHIEHERSVQTWTTLAVLLVALGATVGRAAWQRGLANIPFVMMVCYLVPTGLLAFLFWFCLRPKKTVDKAESLQRAYSEHWFFKGVEQA